MREKSQVLIRNGDIADMDKAWMLGGNVIKRTKV